MCVVAHQRREVLKHQQHHDQRQRQAATDRRQVGHDGARQAQVAHWHPPEPGSWQQSADQHRDDKLPCHQIPDLLRVRLQHVDHHGRVNDDAVAEHEIASHGGRDQCQRDDRFERPAPTSQRQHTEGAGKNHDQEDQAEPQATRIVQLGQPIKGLPQGQISDRGYPQAGQRNNQQRVHGLVGGGMEKEGGLRQLSHSEQLQRHDSELSSIATTARCAGQAARAPVWAWQRSGGPG